MKSKKIEDLEKRVVKLEEKAAAVTTTANSEKKTTQRINSSLEIHQQLDLKQVVQILSDSRLKRHV